jgi:hypothetical protein
MTTGGFARDFMRREEFKSAPAASSLELARATVMRDLYDCSTDFNANQREAEILAECRA